MDDTEVFKVLDNRWQDLHVEQDDGSILLEQLYRYNTVKLKSGYFFREVYGLISWAGTRGELSIIFGRKYFTIEKNGEVIKENRKFQDRISQAEKRKTINVIIEHDPVIRRFATLIDKGDELILEIRKPKDESDGE